MTQTTGSASVLTGIDWLAIAIYFSVLLSVAGGGLGLLLAFWLVHFLYKRKIFLRL